MSGLSWRAGLVPARLVFGAAADTVRAAADLVYPRVCMACTERPADGFCDACVLEIASATGPTCARCGRFLRAPGIACKDCAQTTFAFSRARGVARYTGTLRALVRRFKLGAEPHLARPLAALLFDLAESSRADAVVPVPISRLKLLLRGYNQAELLAQFVARRLGRPLFPKALRRLRKAGKQAFLTRASRIANAAGLYAPGRAELAGKRILLVDDVITTGATSSACAAALLQMGAREVVAIALGR